MDEPGLMSFLHDLHSALIDLVGRDGYELLIQNERGLGYALAQGMKKAKGEWILTIDADGQHDPRDIVKLWKVRADAQIIIGGKPRQSDSRSLFKRLASKVYYHYVRPKDFDVRDLGSNFRLYQRTVIPEFKDYPRGRKFLQWILFQALARNAVIIEVPVAFLVRKAGKSKLSYRTELLDRLR